MNELVYRSSDRYKLISNQIELVIKKKNLQPVLFYTKRDVFYNIFSDLRKTFDRWLSGKIDDYTESLNVNEVRHFENGSKGQDVFADRSFYIFKMYELLKDPPTEFIVPTTIRLEDEWITHPGTTKIPLSKFFSKNLIIKILMFKGRNEQEDKKIQELSLHSESVFDLKSLSAEVLYKVFKFDSYLGNSIALNVYDTFFEISEYHQDIPNFTSDKSYDLELTDKHLLVNNKVFCHKHNNLWEFKNEKSFR